jgi:hypothetical protein
MPEAITVIEIISSKPMMHIDTCIKIPGHQTYTGHIQRMLKNLSWLME